MKKIMLLLALTLSAGSIMAQADDKAKAKAEAAALKTAQKEAKSQMAEAQKIYDAINAKIQEKTAGDPEILSECKKGQELIQKAIKSGLIEKDKLGLAYKLSSDLAMQPHNIQLSYAAGKYPLDTIAFYDNLFLLTDAIHGELTNTKVTKGDTGNEGYLKGKTLNLAQCGVHYIYAAQFESACHRYERALAAYDFVMKYKQTYPEAAEMLNLPIKNEQIAYYAFHTAHDAKLYDAMDKYYDQAIQFADGAEGTKQVKVMSYLERGDSASWAGYVREMTIKEPANNADYVQILLAYYQKQGSDKMNEYADAILATDPNLYIANYGKAYVMFSSEKYDEALTYYKKCSEIKPDQYDAWYQAGLCKFRQALALNATISSIKNQQKAKEALEQTKKMFGEAIPYFEKAKDCTPDEPMKWAYELKRCYTVTGQSDKAAEMDKLL